MQINEVVFGRLTPERVKNILSDYRAGKTVDYRTLPRTTNPLSDYLASGDELVLLANVDQIDPLSLDAYLERGGYEGLKKALAMTQEEVVNTVKDSGLRGRGGAGFPTGLKWSFTRPSPVTPKYIVCNADEGEPGTIKDRYIMEGDPHRVLEGMAIAGYAVGASVGYIYCRGEYYLSMYRLNKAIEAAKAKNLLGDNIQGTDFSFHIQVQTGGGSYVCGEETALIESIQGERGNPRVKPPFPGQVGVWYKPTIVNNVESLSSGAGHPGQRPRMVQVQGHRGHQGHQDFAGGGPGEAPRRGRGQPGDAAAGTHRQVRRRRPATAAPSRPASPAAPRWASSWTSIWTPPWNTRPWPRLQGGLGSGTMLVMDDTVCVIDVVKCLLYFFQHESCGFCLPCRRGTRVLYEMICKVAAGKATQADLDRMLTLGQTMVEVRQLRPGLVPVFFPEDHHGALQRRIRRPPGRQLPPGGLQGGRAFALETWWHRLSSRASSPARCRRRQSVGRALPAGKWWAVPTLHE